jgi:hypothetical protein
MKLIYVLIFLIFFISHSYCDDLQQSEIFTEQQETHFLQKTGFSYEGIDSLDIETGNNIVALENYRNLYHREMINTFIVLNGEEMILKNIYQNGLLITSYSSRNDTEPEYSCIYDENNRIIKSGREWTYEYIDGKVVGTMERKVYYFGELYRIEQLNAQINGYEAITNSNGYEQSVRYVKADGRIELIIRKADGRESNWDTFTYDNECVKQIITATNTKDDIRKIRTVIKRQGENIQELEIKYFRNNLCESIEYWTFSNYDEYGNWHNAKWNSSLGFNEEYYRNIEYNILP